MQKPNAYINLGTDGTYDAFVKDKGFRARCALTEALEFIRENTGRTSGSVPLWNSAEQCWDSELDLAEGA